MKTAPQFTAGDRVYLATPPHNLRHIGGWSGTVSRTFGQGGCLFAEVVFDRPEGGPPIETHVACRFLAALKSTVEKRRGALNLHAPQDTRSEAERQAEGVNWLRAHGYEVLEVGQFRPQAICAKCSREAKRMVKAFCRNCNAACYSPNTGSTKGTPDTSIAGKDWPKGCWLGMEWKDGPNGRRRDEQADLEAAGRIVVVWDLRSCLTAVFEFEDEALRRPVHPEIIAWLLSHDAIAGVDDDGSGGTKTNLENCA